MTMQFLMRKRSCASNRSAQRGATLVIGLIVLVLITIIVVNAFTLSSSNLKSVGNMQIRAEATAAANQVVEKMISAPFYQAVGTQTFTVDINNDGVNDYQVAVAAPVCLGTQQASAAAPSDVGLPVAMQIGAEWQTDWDIAATVTDTASGATVQVREGVRKRMSQMDKTKYCP